MKIYLESLYDYRGKWIDLTSIDIEELQEIEMHLSRNGQHDIIIADWEDIYFNINIYSNWVKVFEKVQLIQKLDMEKGQIEMIENLGYKFIDLDEYEIKEKLENIYSIEVENDEDFAYEYYSQLYNIEKEIPSIFANAIDYSKLYRDLEIELTIQKTDNLYYYTY